MVTGDTNIIAILKHLPCSENIYAISEHMFASRIKNMYASSENIFHSFLSSFLPATIPFSFRTFRSSLYPTPSILLLFPLILSSSILSSIPLFLMFLSVLA